MSRVPNPLFLERRSYRRRRLTDAARLLPVVGALAFLLPLLWAPDRADTAATAATTVYVFVVWAVLILSAILLSRALRRQGEDDLSPPDGEHEE